MEHFIGAYKQYADFSGRANRQKYWMFYLFYLIIYIVLGVVEGFFGTQILLGAIFALASFIPLIAITTRRLHDTGKSGWWQLIILIPIIGALVLLFFYVSKGTPGDNEYGSDPLSTVT